MSENEYGQSEPYGRIDIDLIRKPQLLGCERTPFLVMLTTVCFVTLVAFGITPQGVIAGIILFAAGLIVLRGFARQDPYWFAARIEASKYPRHMPNVPPDETLPHLPFAGYDDPPKGNTVIIAWFAVIGFCALISLPFYFLVGLLWMTITFAASLTIITTIVFVLDPDEYHRRY